MFLFILESIGTSELIFIGIIALIFLGPRKLPQIAKTIGKAMADFRNTTNEFKSTWEREVDFDEEVRAIRTGDLSDGESATVPRIETAHEETNKIAPPEIRPVQSDLFASDPSVPQPAPDPDNDPNEEIDSHDPLSDKRSWL